MYLKYCIWQNRNVLFFFIFDDANNFSEMELAFCFVYQTLDAICRICNSIRDFLVSNASCQATYVDYGM